MLARGARACPCAAQRAAGAAQASPSGVTSGLAGAGHTRAGGPPAGVVRAPLAQSLSTLQPPPVSSRSRGRSRASRARLCRDSCVSLGLPVCGNTSHAPGNITGWPGILPPEAGNFTVTVILPPGPTVILPSGGNITAPVGNVTGWAGILPSGLVIFQAGGDIPGLWRRDSRPARGCSRRWGGYSPPPCGRMCRGV